MEISFGSVFKSFQLEGVWSLVVIRVVHRSEVKNVQNLS